MVAPGYTLFSVIFVIMTLGFYHLYMTGMIMHFFVSYLVPYYVTTLSCTIYITTLACTFHFATEEDSLEPGATETFGVITFSVKKKVMYSLFKRPTRCSPQQYTLIHSNTFCFSLMIWLKNSKTNCLNLYLSVLMLISTPWVVEKEIYANLVSKYSKGAAHSAFIGCIRTRFLTITGFFSWAARQLLSRL